MMRIESLRLQNFRCHKDLFISFPEGPVCIYGPNGAGKTSIAEALYLLLTLKTFRKNTIAEAVSFGADYFRIEGKLNNAYINDAVFFYDTGRTLLTDGNPEPDPALYTYNFPVLCYSPNFESFLSPEHADRRAVIDRAIFYTDRSHLKNVKDYNKLLLRKRALLSSGNIDSLILLAINERMQPLSDEISNRRTEFIASLMALLADDPVYNSIMPDIEFKLSVSTLSGKDPEMEIKACRPLYGCHRDLLYMKQDGHAVEKFRSFGQRKSCLLFVLYHIAKYIEKIRKSGIILLLDDFEAGLDKSRIDLLNGLFLQSDNFIRQIILTGITAPSNSGITPIELRSDGLIV